MTLWYILYTMKNGREGEIGDVVIKTVGNVLAGSQGGCVLWVNVHLPSTHVALFPQLI
jgi:hypothetical protein